MSEKRKSVEDVLREAGVQDLDSIERPDLSGLYDSLPPENPAERKLHDTVLIHAEAYWQAMRAERPEVDGMFGSAPNKIGPPGPVVTFDRSTDGTCCRPNANGITFASTACKGPCYARKLENYTDVRARHEANDRLATDPNIDLAKLVIGRLQASTHNTRRIDYLRLHDAGEFDTVQYAEAWVRICTACYWVKFWVYTRSHTDPNILRVLRKLNHLSNVKVVLSYDRAMAVPPDDFAHAYFAVDDDDAPPPGAPKPLVVFRRVRNTPVPHILDRYFVCLHELGNDSPAPDCVNCQRCLPANPSYEPLDDVGFSYGTWLDGL